MIRWQDWTNVVLGCGLVVSPWVLDYTLNGAATGNACALGAAIAIFNLISVFRLIDEGQEIFNILLGAWLILSPFSLNFRAERPAMVSAIAAGVVLVVLAAWQLRDAMAGKANDEEEKEG
jgi:hypothetical protein